jgi:hypothetical protein
VDVPNTVVLTRPAELARRFASALKASPASAPPDRREDALAVLSATRGVIARGWVQNTWYLVETPGGRRRAGQRFFPGRLDHRHVVGACLVGGVMQGAWQLSSHSEYAYPAIDALWHTLFETGVDVGPPVPPLVRATRVRDLTTWNDRGYRTSDEVLRLVDAASTRLVRSGPPVRP